jgi:hypothetical protein
MTQHYSSIYFHFFSFWDFAMQVCNNPCPFELLVSEIPKYRSLKCQSSTPKGDQRLIASPNPTAQDPFDILWVKSPELLPFACPVSKMSKSSFWGLPLTSTTTMYPPAMNGPDAFGISGVRTSYLRTLPPRTPGI